MAKITGVGGFFLKTRDAAATARWFTDTLGMPTATWGCSFPWRDRDEPDKRGYTVLGLHAETSDYFAPSPHAFMLNLRVDDLDGMLETLRARGVEILDVMPPEPNGRFAHVMGPDGVKIELWEPVANDPYDP